MTSSQIIVLFSYRLQRDLYKCVLVRIHLTYDLPYLQLRKQERVYVHHILQLYVRRTVGKIVERRDQVLITCFLLRCILVLPLFSLSDHRQMVLFLSCEPILVPPFVIDHGSYLNRSCNPIIFYGDEQ